jgi:hypothetical protein
VDIVAQQRVNSCCWTRKNFKLILLLHPQKNYDNNQRGPYFYARESWMADKDYRCIINYNYKRLEAMGTVITF